MDDVPLNENSVKKNVAAIHIEGQLTLVQRKSINALLVNAYDRLLTEQIHSIPVAALAAYIGYNSKDVSKLKSALRKLTSTSVEWDILNKDGNEEWVTSAILSHARIYKGVIEYSYSPELAKKLYNPEIYERINLDIQKKFSSGYALALYENCVRFRNAKSTGWWTIDTFRRLMGVAENKNFHVFKRLKARVIMPAVREVNATTDIIVEPEFERKGRSIQSVRFMVSSNPQLSLLKMEDDERIKSTKAFKAAKNFGINDRLAYQWIMELGEDYVLAKIRYVQQQEKGGKIKGAASGYLVKAVEDDWQTESEVRAKSARAYKEKKDQDQANKLKYEELLNTRLQIERGYRSIFAHTIYAITSSLPESEAAAIKNEFIAVLKTDWERKDFQKNAWNSALCFTQIFNYWTSKRPEDFVSIEAFAKDEGVNDWQALVCDIKTLKSTRI